MRGETLNYSTQATKDPMAGMPWGLSLEPVTIDFLGGAYCVTTQGPAVVPMTAR